jgi:hypothetical protein
MRFFRAPRILCALALASSATGQTQPPAPPAAPAEQAAPAPGGPPSLPSWYGFNLSGAFDAYVTKGFNNPASEFSRGRSFDINSNTGGLNALRFNLDREAKPLGFRADFGFGSQFDGFYTSSLTRQPEWSNYVIQAYVTLKPESWKGAALDFGKFYTSAGAELTETHLNWNYSRGLLYQNGPFHHTGLRFTAPVTKELTLGAQLVQGWNNLEDNNSGKTVGLTSLYTKGKVIWANNYYVGPEKNGTNKGIRHFYDTVVTINATDKFSWLVNFDYGQEKQLDGKTFKFLGVSTGARYTVNSKFSFSPRFDWYNDIDGFITGADQSIKAFTITGDYKIVEGLLTRLEYRRDVSNADFYDRGRTNTLWPSQGTLLVGVVAYFGKTH